ncbi:hypothetical protein M0657_011319 [Pyricularia oryzae]|nr:hypothetical protein M9X92_011253 [Pyricularia oryzae]KAI7910608.1 hypothetical protein M0657_011319 [Pyricularia oryzae]
MFHIRFSSLAPCSVLCPLLAISQKAVFTSTSPVPETSLSTRESKGAPKFQPSIDFAADGCYNRPAVDKNGSVSAGLPFATTTTSAHGDCDVKPVAGVRMDGTLRNPPKGPWFHGALRSPGSRGWGLYPGPHRQFDTMEMKAMERGPKKDNFDCAHDEQPASGLQAEW